MEIALKEIIDLVKEKTDESCSFEIGKNYLIRTVTFIYTGKLKAIYKNELVLSDAAWIVETERFADTLKKSIFKEVEPYTNDCIVSRGAIVDATIIDSIPKEQK